MKSLPVHARRLPVTAGLAVAVVLAGAGVSAATPSPVAEKVQVVHGNCTLFDDAMWHGTSIPEDGKRRIIIRVFGEMDWDKIAERIVPGSAYHVNA